MEIYTLDTLIGDIVWEAELRNGGDDTLYYSKGFAHEDTYPIGILTVLDRLTGFMGNIRDIETGYAAPDGSFALVSGGFDIREYQTLTIKEAIALVLAKADRWKENSDA